VSYRLAQLPVTFSDLDGRFCCLKPFYLSYFWKHRVYYLGYDAHESESAHSLACNSIYLFENEGRVNVVMTNVSETVPEGFVLTTDH